MLEIAVNAVAGWPVSSALRKSQWVYPLVNTAHILGLALLVGSMAALDLRLLGFARAVAVVPVAQFLIRVARFGLVLAMMMGALLFIARPADYTFNQLFQIKLLLIGLALANIFCLHRSAQWRELMASNDPVAGPVHPRIQLAAVVSMLLWCGVVLVGRLIGYR